MGFDEIEHAPASNRESWVAPRETNVPAGPLLGLIVVMAAAVAFTKKVPSENGLPEVVWSSILMAPLSPGVAVVATVNPAVSVPLAFMVQALLTTSPGGKVDPVKLNVQARTDAALVNPPPVMLTVPQPGGAFVGAIE